MVTKGNLFKMLSIVIAMIGLIIIVGPLTDQWTEPKTVNATLLVTADVVTLDPASVYVPREGGSFANKHIKHFSASGASGCTPNSFSSVDGVTLSYPAGLKAGDCKITYRTEKTSSQDYMTLFLQLLPFLITGGVVTGTIAYRAQSAVRKGGNFGIEQAVTLVIAIILIPIITNFVGRAEAAYEVIPAYFGVGLLLGLTTLGYILSVVIEASGSMGPQALGGLRRMRGGSSSKAGMR